MRHALDTLAFAFILGAAASLSAGKAGAHGPTPQRTEEKILIAAPPAAVWAVIKAFHGLASWHPLVVQSAGTGGDAVGAERQITFKGGGGLSESLDEYDGARMSYSYRLSGENVEALPVSFYSASISVRMGAGGGSEVEWISRYYRADTTNEPPEHLNDDAAAKAMGAFMRAGLQGIKDKAEDRTPQSVSR